MEYPECEKLVNASKQSQVIWDFIEWLEHHKGYTLAHYPDKTDNLRPVHYNIQNMLAEFFDIDTDKVENALRDIINNIRKSQKKCLKKSTTNL